MISMLARSAVAASVVATAGFTAPTVAEARDGGWAKLCRPYVNTQVHGAFNSVRQAVNLCAELTNIIRGYGNDIEVQVIGPNLVSVTSLGNGNVSRYRISGADNVIGAITMNGGRTIVDVDGGDNQTGGYNNGCGVRTSITGNGNSVFTECSAY